MRPAFLGRRLLISGGALAPLVLAPMARAQTALPEKPMRLIVGSTASSGEDKMARSIAPRLETRIGRHVTVDNKPSANGTSAGEAILRGPKDGTTLALMGSEILAGSLTVPGFPFDPLKDLTAVTIAGGTHTGLAVAASTGASTLADYLDWMKAGGPERRKIGSHACPAFTDVFMKLIEPKIGEKLEIVPHRGAAAMLNDMASGRLPACLTALTSLLEHHRGPRLKIVMSSADERSKLAANVPTAAELGYPALQVRDWLGIFVSSGAPKPVVETWNRQLAAVILDGEVRAELQQLGLEVAPTNIEDAGTIVASYLKDWKDRLQALGAKQPG